MGTPTMQSPHVSQRPRPFFVPTLRVFAVACVTSLALAGCASPNEENGDGEESEGSNSCASVITFDERSYREVKADNELEAVQKLGTGQVPACNDTNDPPAEEGVKVDVWRLKGVEPTVAVAVDHGGMALYVSDTSKDLCQIRYIDCK
jgi:hypothetical protein